MAAPIRFLSGRNQQQKIGIEGSTENQKVLEVVGRVGIGTTIFEPTSELEVRGDVIVSGELTVGDTTFGVDFSTGNLSVSGLSTFSSAVDINANLDVDGITELDITNISETLNVTGIATFGSDVDLNANLDVDGITELDITNISETLNVTGIATFGSDVDLNANLDVDGHTELDDVNVSGAITATTFTGNLTGIASTATKLETSRNFSISGDFVTASSISFDGTGDVSLGATIATNSIGLGTYTTGDYVKSISGTGNEITVTSGTGEGSTPVISIPDNPTLPGTTVTIATDLQVNRNLNVTGNITIGGTTAFVDVERLRITDADIVLGYRTDSNNNDASNDTTASHGGVAVASTEGSPLISLIGAGETLPATYKKIMWFQSGAFTGLATDSWLTNYAFGVGTTSMSAGTKFAVGNIETDFDDITSVVNINSSGIVTATEFVGALSGTATTANNLSNGSNITEGTINDARLPDLITSNIDASSGVSTFIGLKVGTAITMSAGIITATKFVGDGSELTDITASQVGALSGVIIREDGGSSLGSVGDINFVSSNLTATASGAAATITLSATPTFTSTVIGTGVTINSSGINATTGIITASSFIGDGSGLSGISGGTAFDENETTNQSQTIPFYVSTATTDVAGVSTQSFVFNPSTKRLGIGTDTPISSLHVVGDAKVTGIVTATTFDGDLTGNVNASSGVSTFTELKVGTAITMSAGIITATRFEGEFDGNVTGVSSGIALTATKLETARDFSITGDLEASIISFNGSGNVSLASTLSSSFSANTSGIITASEFDGGLTGNVNASSGVSTFTQLKVGTAITMSAGIITATSFTGADGNPSLKIDGGKVGFNAGISQFGYVKEDSATSDLEIGASNGIILAVDGGGVLYVNLSGNVGVGSAIPSSKLDVDGTVTATEFVGGLTGTATTATNLSSGANITTGTIDNARLPDLITSNINASSGVSTFTQLKVGTAITMSAGIVTANYYYGDGANLINLPAPAGGGDKYNTGITTSVYVSITGGIGTAQAGLSTVAANNDIFIGPGIATQFPSTAGKSYIIESIHVTNIYNTNLYLTSRHDFNGGENVPTAQRVVIPYQGALEVLEEPIIAKPSDILRFQAFVGVGTTATGVNDGLDSFITYTEKTDTDYIGTGVTVTAPAGTELFTSTTNPSVIQSIRLCNYDLNIDVDASVSIYRGGSVGGILTTGVRNGYLVYNLTVPKNSAIEILERPKYLAANDTVVVGIAGTTLTNSLSSTLSGKYIT